MGSPTTSLGTFGEVFREIRWVAVSDKITVIVGRIPETVGRILVIVGRILAKLVERTALEFAERNGLDLVTVVLPIVVGPFVCPNVPSSVYMGMAPIFGDQEQCKYLVSTYMVHIDDVASAHIFLLEHANAKGRYICSSIQTTIHDQVMEIKGYKGTNVSSMKLLNTGFKFKYGLGKMFDGAIQSCKEKGFL
ncbi:putative vestitone reductase [Rosa chinensis]|uniref:Putative vestitone reductase n=1 Tax=Rosa chinensis TaxID=74649 RepID=A0A2P6SG18_ROSCH|nr:putative vestitone reductase [Rosa chinensis]